MAGNITETNGDEMTQFTKDKKGMLKGSIPKRVVSPGGFEPPTKGFESPRGRFEVG